uniref:Uncharacterized protein n=1 Tax=Caenorhabditis japonica TaxID=281687 RepID=A0A8R1DIU4_CAEJA
MPETSDNVEDAVDALEKEMLSFCNLIPVNVWGFDDDVKESLKMRKHSLVNRQLSKKEKKSMSAQQKQQLAKGLGLVPNTVQEVLEWMSHSKKHSKVQPQKAIVIDKVVKKQVAPKKSEEADDSDDSESEDEEKEAPVAVNGNSKASDSEESDAEDAEAQAEQDDDSDTTDEETEEPVAKKAKIISTSTLKSNDKIDKEIKKLEEGGDDNQTPELKRQLALLRLQKKLKEMKTDRKGKGSAKSTPAMSEKLAEEKRLKRRESKLKLKQRRAEEKKGKEVKVKNEADGGGGGDADGTSENGAAGEKKKSGISFNNLKFEIKEDKQRGKRERVRFLLFLGGLIRTVIWKCHSLAFTVK